MGPAVWWVKRDARLADNPALSAAVARHPAVLPVFCHEPLLLQSADTSPMHAHAWTQAVAGLRAGLRRRGADVFVAHADAVPTLAAVRRWFPFTHVYAHEEVGTAATFARDDAVRLWCRDRGVAYREYPQSSVVRGGVDRDRLGRVWKARVADPSPLPAVGRVPMPSDALHRAEATELPAIAGSADWQPVSETHAHKTLSQFLATRGFGYSGGISSPNTAFVCGSRLSPHLAWGTLSVRQAYHATVARLRGLDPADPATPRWNRSLKNFLARLHWRDHFAQRLETEPGMEFRSIHPAYRHLPAEDDPRLLAAWAAGRTGFPLVDAVMRCLAATGFANFRMRAMAVSFACHALHLSWQAVHLPLCRVFRDYDPGIHFSQLQMQAGVVGINSVRVYSPHKQLAEQDPRCKFVRQWVPELRTARVEAIGDHHRRPVPGYVPAVVDFAERSRQTARVLFAVRAAQSAADTLAVFKRHGSRRRVPARRRFGRADQPSLF
jgi:deoxyribodipyrimidine photo-lyase